VWFVGFCFLANQWQVAKPEDNPLKEGGDAARAAITFAFFSIFTWVCTENISILVSFSECFSSKNKISSKNVIIVNSNNTVTHQNQKTFRTHLTKMLILNISYIILDI